MSTAAADTSTAVGQAGHGDVKVNWNGGPWFLQISALNLGCCDIGGFGGPPLQKQPQANQGVASRVF